MRFGFASVIANVIAYVITHAVVYVIAYVIAYCITYVITYVIINFITYLITCGNAYVITYPYSRTVNFEMRLKMQLRSHQPPIPKKTQAPASSYKYIGRWMGKTEGSPTGLGENFGRLDG